jgi:hypothetical protein
VALAIAVAPEERPQTATSLSDLILDGAHGISPYSDDAPTRSLGSNEAATRVLRPHVHDRTAATKVTRAVPAPRPAPSRTPRTVPARRPELEPELTSGRATKSPDRRARRRRARRLAWLLTFLLALVVAAVIVVVLISQADQTVVHYQRIVSKDYTDAINQLQKVISRYTK